MRDLSARAQSLPRVPDRRAGLIEVRLQEEMIADRVLGRKPAARDIIFAGDRQKMQHAEFAANGIGPIQRRERQHHVRLIFPQIVEIADRLEVNLDLRIARGKRGHRWRGEERRHAVRHADAYDAFRVLGTRLQVAGDRKQALIQDQQRGGEFLASFRELHAHLGRNEELRADKILQAPHLSRDRRLAQPEPFRCAVERFRLRHFGEDAQLGPVAAAEQAGFDRRRRRKNQIGHGVPDPLRGRVDLGFLIQAQARRVCRKGSNICHLLTSSEAVS